MPPVPPRKYQVIGEAVTEEGGRVGLTVQVMPPGAVVDVSWSPEEVTARSGYRAWGIHREEILGGAMAEAKAFMREHPEAHRFFRASIRARGVH